ncbi:MAG: efflux RND transporter periplasmic adaptor subunit [Proteobacteria bacterium]|nr:efflux RND transporter periplasmic adaptor subunit [Desulfobulbaceae bacterium]MBU4152983.1 efflux RND transporter periplasmic adaptor subunit [Pseudomonadota bacterium]
MHPFIIKDEPGDCPICGMKLVPVKPGTTGGAKTESAKPQGERKIKYWAAPMDPTYIRNEPGKSPMGMDLVPVYEDQAATGSIISIDPVTIQNMGISTAKVEQKALHRDLRTVGLVAYDESRQYSINSKVSGWIERLTVNETGQFVKKGTPLLSIYSPDLVSAQEEYLLALNNNQALAKSDFPQIAEGAQRLLEASRSRLKYWDISEQQISELTKTGKVRKTMTLYSSYSGIVTMKMVNEGMFINAGMELFKLSDISKIWINADIYEYELPWVKEGQEAVVEFPYGDMKTLTGKVSYIYPYVEPKTRTVKVRLEFDNPGYHLKPDLYVNVRLNTQPIEDALVIPRNAVLYSGEKRTVFVTLGGGKFEPRLIKIGVEGDQGMVQVTQGLFAGEEIVTSAQFMLDSESQLREAIQKMLEPKKPSESAKPEPMKDPPQEGATGKKNEDLDDLFK